MTRHTHTRSPDPAGGGQDTYLELVRRHPLRPLRSETDLDAAIALVDELLDRADRDPGEQDYLDVLSALIEKYEAVAHPLPDVPDAEMLRHLIEARGVTQGRVAAEAGIAESTISQVLSGRRALNRRHIDALSRYFHVSPAVFLSH